ncbi:UNVERIFIED_CONTAM: hypothetical protein Sradi_5718000 [Sesamum radiatum]|uniref:SWIM-type domain-containing protein n=1 Tax=Sesamum radiatum TaxID=300843 RepID=A0AAW2L1N2_SESRA
MARVLDCFPLKADDYSYEIMCFDSSRLSVDLAKHFCACREWNLTGIPCKHALSTILSKIHDPKDYVHQNYKVETFLRVYGPAIQPVPHLPPNFGRGVGRHPKVRRKEDEELVRKQKKG